MIECIFTLDYEIYGNGFGSLKEMVFEPAKRLQAIFEKSLERFVVFVEAAELERIEESGTDDSIALVKKQVRSFYESGFEVGLHLHPQWVNAKRINGSWQMDDSEYNLCNLSGERIDEIVARSIRYLRDLLSDFNFTPLSFRAGNWLFQPSHLLAETLIAHGIRIDSSVFKGGRLHKQGLDYRRALNNGYAWPFSDDVTVPDLQGRLVEVPIHTEMVPIWKAFTSKRLKLQTRGPVKPHSEISLDRRWKDFLRFRFPLKLDFCRLSFDELAWMISRIIRKDRQDPLTFRPIVVIGHTKDFIDDGTVESLLTYLKDNGIPVSLFHRFLEKFAPILTGTVK